MVLTTKALADLCLEGGALEAVSKITAPMRAKSREEAALQAAKEWVWAHSPRSGSTIYDQEGAVAFLLMAEVRGLYGGGYRAPGAGTARHPAFRNLGSGRRHAQDGLAWTTAIASAAWKWSASLPVLMDGVLRVQMTRDLMQTEGEPLEGLVDPELTLGDPLAWQGWCRATLVAERERLASGTDPFEPGVLSLLAAGAAGMGGSVA
jgi:hypothetical protein